MKTVYCVQLFTGTRERIQKGALRQFGAADQALGLAEQMKGRAAGGLVFRVSGDPATDCWSEPEVLARFGVTPEPA